MDVLRQRVGGGRRELKHLKNQMEADVPRFFDSLP